MIEANWWMNKHPGSLWGNEKLAVVCRCGERFGLHFGDPPTFYYEPSGCKEFHPMEASMNKHCASHTHYVPDCQPCKRAYAEFKQGITPVMNAKPGKPFAVSEGEVDNSFFAPAPVEEVLDSDGIEGGAPMEAKDLSKLSVPELRALCSKKGITRIDGMPVSNCRRDALTAALQGKPTPGSSDGKPSSDMGKGEGEAGTEYGPEEGKPAPIPIPPPMMPFADSILKSQEFEDAVRHADVLGDVKADFEMTNKQFNAVAKDMQALGKRVDAIIQDGVKGGTTTITVHSKGELPVPALSGEIPNSPILKRVIEHLSNREHVALVGPAGSGKSTIVRMACTALGATLYHTPCGGDIREQHLLGRTIPVQGEWTYIPAPFVQAFESETFSIAMLDEMDGVSDPSVLLPINDVLAGFDKLHLPWRWNAPYAERGKGFLGVAATMNTIGAGATSMYQGRTALDGSTLDRFVGRIIVVPYDANYEEAYVKGPAGTPVCPHGDEFLLWVRTLRTKVEANNLRRIVSTRMLQQGVAMLRRDWKLTQVKDALLTGWSPDDKRICGVS